MIRIKGSSTYACLNDLVNNKFVNIETNNRFITSENEKYLEYDRVEKISHSQKEIANFIWNNQKPPFKLISIETSSRCNQICKFCPVNRDNDPRPVGLLPSEIINKIADELSDINYTGTILLFGNNEPLLDKRIVSHVALFRKSCPKAYIKLLTNGILLTSELAVELFKQGLSTLTINNYSDNNSFSTSVKRIIESAEIFGCYDLRISLRSLSQLLTNRCGQVTSQNPINHKSIFCNLPFVDLCITYTGIVTLCCFDAIQQSCMGDIYKSTLIDIWHGKEFQVIRDNQLANNRISIPLCSVCDFDGFRDPMQDWVLPLTREDLL